MQGSYVVKIKILEQYGLANKTKQNKSQELLLGQLPFICLLPPRKHQRIGAGVSDQQRRTQE